MNPLRGVMIGAGFFARFQAEAWKRMPDVRILAVADFDRGRAENFANEFSIPRVYATAEEALVSEKPDFVDIVTRPEAHLELTRIAAAHRAHVICQKPMAPTMSDCLAMCEACEKTGVRLLIHENWRWQPWYREIKRRLDADAIGRPFQFSFFWRTGDGRGPAPYPTQPYFKQMPRLLIYESLVHLLDTFRYLGGEIESLACQTARINPLIAGEDQALIQLRFASGALGVIDGNRISGPNPAPVAMGSLIAEGEKGTLRVSPEGILDGAEPFPDRGYKGDSVFATQQHLIDSLRAGQPSESDGRDYLKTVALVEACYRSAESGRRERPEF